MEEPSRILYIRSLKAITTNCFTILLHCVCQRMNYVFLQNGDTEISALELRPPSYVLSSVAGLRTPQIWVKMGTARPAKAKFQPSPGELQSSFTLQYCNYSFTRLQTTTVHTVEQSRSLATAWHLTDIPNNFSVGAVRFWSLECLANWFITPS